MDQSSVITKHQEYCPRIASLTVIVKDSRIEIIHSTDRIANRKCLESVIRTNGVSSTIPKLFEKKIFLLRGMDREIRNLSAWKTNLRIVKFLNSLKTTESVRKYGVVMNLKYNKRLLE